MRLVLKAVLSGFLLCLFTSTQLGAAPIVIKNATIVPLSEKATADFFTGYIVFDEGKILEIEEGDYDVSSANESAEVIDAMGKIVMPGFVSGHNHLWQSAFRGLAADKELFGWLGALHYSYGSYFSDGDMYAFTLHGSLDQLAKGITTTYDHSQRLATSETQYRESFQAGLDTAQHFIFSYNSDLKQDEDAVKRNFADFVRSAKPYIGQSPLLGLSLHSVGAYHGSEKLELEVELAKKYKLTSQIHYLEEYQRRYIGRKKWPMFLQSGAVNSGVSFAHFIHTTDTILQDSAKAGASMIWNPLSNGRLASGLADIPKYLEMGVKVGMGVDGAASADIADPFENMRMGMYALRMRQHNANVMLPLEILKLHTIKTAQVLQVDKEVGSLEVGKYADLLIVNPAQPATGAVFDPLATLVFSCSSANVEAIYVAGELAVAQGKVLGADMGALQQQVEMRVENILAQADKKTVH